MQVLRKFSNLSEIDQSALGMVSIYGYGPTKSFVCEIPDHKQQKINCIKNSKSKCWLNEVVDTIFRKGIDLCCAHECRWRGASTRMLEDKECHYKFWGVGTGGVGVL